MGEHIGWNFLWVFSLLSTLLIPTVLAGVESSDPYTTPGWFPRPSTPQFRNWYPKYHELLERLSTTVCNQSLSDYDEFFSAPHGSAEASYLLLACYRHEACILDNISADQMANFNGANVLLGLLPTLLSAIGPSVAEISLLSTHRPLLSFLISVGAPAIWPTRLFEYTNPLSSLQRGENKLVVLELRSWLVILASVVEYVVVMGAVANIISTSVGIGQSTILAWGCTTTFMPLLWTTLSCVIHFIAASSYAITKCLAENRSSMSPGSSGSTVSASKNAHTRISPPSTPTKPSFRFRLARACRAEFTICANQHISAPGNDKVKAGVPHVAILLNVIAGIMGYIHVTFGIIVFSSVQFVSVWDVLNRILMRYLASTLMSRLVLVFELGGLRRVEDEDR